MSDPSIQLLIQMSAVNVAEGVRLHAGLSEKTDVIPYNSGFDLNIVRILHPDTIHYLWYAERAGLVTCLFKLGGVQARYKLVCQSRRDVGE